MKQSSQSIGTIGFNKLNTTGQLEPIGNNKVKLSKQEVLGCDIGLSDYQDLMHPRFYKWYCKAWYDIGREKFHQLASQARVDGKDPARLFSSLIKKELLRISVNV